MKNQTTKKLAAFIIMMMFSFTFVNAQTCPGNKVWACRTSNCVQECKCINANNVTHWQANGHPCYPEPCNCLIKPISQFCAPICGGKISSSDNDKPFISFTTSIVPNPVSNSTTISFSLVKEEKIALKIFDVNGRLVATLADKMFEAGENEIEWNAKDVNAGIYFLQFQSAEILQTEKLIVTK